MRNKINLSQRIPDQAAGLRLDQAAAELFPDYSRGRLQEWIKRGELTIDGKRTKPMPMTETEARRFIHSARFGNYLLYPFMEGKRIRLIDTVPVEGAICHKIRVELDTEYQIDYYIDIQTSLEVKVVNQDLRTGSVNSIIYRDYTRDFGIPIAKKVESREEGEWVSTLIREEIKLNTGIMPWMFHMPE